MNSPTLELRDILVSRGGRTVLQVESLQVLQDQVLAVIGPNGAGKSTLIEVLALLEKPNRGSLLFRDQPVNRDALRIRRRMAVVFQEPLLLDTTVEANVSTGLTLRGVPAGERRRRVNQWLERFGIAGLARRSARTLSGGEAQRTSLARALALQPEVLLLDEPFAALDLPTREALIDDLDRILRSVQMATVFVTHERSEALRLGDRVAVIMGGRIRQIGTPGEVFAAPADVDVAGFLGIETIVPGRLRCVEEGIALVEIGERTIQAVSEGGQPGSEVLVCLRPEDLALSPPADATGVTSARNHLPATVRRINAASPYVRVELDAGFPVVALITKQSLEALELAPGSKVIASFKATAVHLIPRQPHSGPAPNQTLA